MSRTIILIPTDINVSLTSVSLGILHSIKQKEVNVTIFKPIDQSNISNKKQVTKILHNHSNIKINKPLKISYVESLLANNKKDILMEKIVGNYYHNTRQFKIIIVKGLTPSKKYPFLQSLNYDIAKTLGAEIILVSALNNNALKQLKDSVKLSCIEFGGIQNKNIKGLIINKYNHNISNTLEIFAEPKKVIITKNDKKILNNNSPLPILGCIPWNSNLITIKGIDIANYLNATILNKGELETRHIKSIVLCVQSLYNVVELFNPGSLVIVPSNRNDIIISACLTVLNGIKIGALLLTDGHLFTKTIHNLCNYAFKTKLPVLIVNDNIWQTLSSLQSFDVKLYKNDYKSIKKIQNYISLYINQKWINSFVNNLVPSKKLSPTIFRYQIIKLARKADKRIILPEGNELRTIKAANICTKRNIATCVLLGEPNEIKQISIINGIKLDSRVEIISPNSIRKNYIDLLVELRKNKGMTEIIANKQLEDNVMLGTMMLKKNEVDGLVSGAIHTTANTIRPSLQLIKTTPGNSIVSSIFFMLLPEQVLVYGDCAINPNPTAEQLSEIAIQSANSAKAFNIEPRIAMISYSTGNSGTGNDVEKVREATDLVKTKRPDIIVDGPLQYDAAIIPDVAKSKAPNSPVAGNANVFIFPDLNTGNTTYKAVQRSANIVSIGPILQGMNKPVNDLSRGALIDDIVYTIAITAIQATQTS